MVEHATTYCVYCLLSNNSIDSNYKYNVFKNEVGEVLALHFGQNAVKRGNKAFDIKENSYHVEADVAPFFEHRRYHVCRRSFLIRGGTKT